MKKTQITVGLSLLFVLAACQAPSRQPNVSEPAKASALVLPSAAAVPSPMMSFAANFDGTSEVPVVTTNAKGYGKVVLNESLDEITVWVEVAGLSGDITGAHIHKGDLAVAGEVVKPLVVAGTKLTGTWKKSDPADPLTDTLIEDLKSAKLYINIHTKANPDGELRAQILPTTTLLFPVALNGSNAVPEVNTKASGVAWVKLNPTKDELTLEGWTYNLSGNIIGAHIHKGVAGLAGEVVKPLTVVESHFTGVWKKSDPADPLTDTLIEDLKSGKLYINIHTQANESGELRGQIIN